MVIGAFSVAAPSLPWLRPPRKLWSSSITELWEMADGRNDVLAEASGITAGSWYADPTAHVGHELLAAAMLILAGGGHGVPLDYRDLERWTRIGFERGMASGNGDFATLARVGRETTRAPTNAAYMLGCVCSECRAAA
jgi:hypothetical protein